MTVALRAPAILHVSDGDVGNRQTCRTESACQLDRFVNAELIVVCVASDADARRATPSGSSSMALDVSMLVGTGGARQVPVHD